MKIRKLSAMLALTVLLPVASSSAQVYQDNAPGSFLVFPEFDIRGTTTTTLRIVNHGASAATVKLNYVCPGIKHVNEFCAALDTQVSLTPKQTTVINVEDQNPPCNQGYVVAFAINSAVEPISFNWLTGSYNIASGRLDQADTAVGIQSPQSEGTVLGVGSGVTRQLRFSTCGEGNSGCDYAPMSSVLGTDFRAIGSDPDRGSRLTLLTLDVLAGMQNPPAVAFINFWNAAEVPFSTSREFICWDQVALNQIDANFLEENLGTNNGSMSIQGVPNCPIPGACPPLTPYNATLIGALAEYGDGALTGRIINHNLDTKNTAYQPR